jgi:hypothetical protein
MACAGGISLPSSLEEIPKEKVIELHEVLPAFDPTLAIAGVSCDWQSILGK